MGQRNYSGEQTLQRKFAAEVEITLEEVKYNYHLYGHSYMLTLKFIFRYFLSVTVAQCFADVPRRPPLNSQSSVESLSDMIARDILKSQGDEHPPQQQQHQQNKKTVRTIIDLTESTDDEELLDNSNESAKSWIDSLENDSNTTIVKNNVNNGGHVTPRDELFHTPNASPTPKTNNATKPQHNIACDEKPISERTRDQRSSSSGSNDSITGEINRSKFDERLMSAVVNAGEFVPRSFVQPDEKSFVAPVGDEKSFQQQQQQHHEQQQQHPEQEQLFDELFDTDSVVLYVLDEVISALVSYPEDFDDRIDHLTHHMVHFVTQEGTLKQVIDRIIGKVNN